MLYILHALHITRPTAAQALNEATTLISFIAMVIQLMGEELLKVILFIIVMFIAYKFLNRKVSIVISIIITLCAFGFPHMGFYGGAINVLLIQGLGSIFNLLLYIKTRNIMVSYFSHLLLTVSQYYWK